jgi:hypothetical protein
MQNRNPLYDPKKMNCLKLLLSSKPDTRNSVAHGVAESEQYSCTRALQVILTLDHLVCFL